MSCRLEGSLEAGRAGRWGEWAFGGLSPGGRLVLVGGGVNFCVILYERWRGEGALG